MVDFLPEYNLSIFSNIDRFLGQKKVELSKVNSWGADLCTRLRDFTALGKMLRGKLVVLSYLMYSDSLDDAVLDAAAAIELFHSSLLIHDDIIDNDLLRRGYPTLFAQYQKLGEENYFIEPSSFGLSMGICAGDVGFMLSFDMLSRLNDMLHGGGGIVSPPGLSVAQGRSCNVAKVTAVSCNFVVDIGLIIHGVSPNTCGGAYPHRCG